MQVIQLLILYNYDWKKENRLGFIRALSGGGYRAAALESAVASLKEESKAIKQETLEIKSETKKLREERERMSEDLLQKKHELDQLKTTPYPHERWGIRTISLCFHVTMLKKQMR